MSVIDTRNLPLPLVAAISNDDHISLGSDIGAATVGAPVQQVALRRKYAGEIVEEASDRIWALFGQAVHVVLERAGKDQNDQRRKLDDAVALLRSLLPPDGAVDESTHLGSALRDLEALQVMSPASPQPFHTFIEERWEIDVLGWKVAARCDHLTLGDDGTLTDWKVSSVWSVKDGKAKDEWISQVNVTRYCATIAKGLRPKHLACTVFLRDWRKNERLRYGVDYPELQVATVPVPMWSDDQCRAYLEERVDAHQAARAIVDGAIPTSGMAISMGLCDLPLCTPAERWEKPTIYAVMKTGRKTAVRLYEDVIAAGTHARQDAALRVVRRPGESVRCAQYCSVLPFCEQGKRILAELATAADAAGSEA